MHRDFDPSEPFFRLSQVAKEMESLHEFYESVFQIGGFGPWEQIDHHLLYMTPAWCRLFEQKKAPILLEEYLSLIDNEGDRERIRHARQNLSISNCGQVWSDTFSLAGHTIRSMCLTTRSGRLIGVDSILIEPGGPLVIVG